MIAKERKPPRKLLQTEAILRRLQPPDHPKRPIIEQDLKKRKAGYHGEKAVDYHLSFLTDKKYMIFNDLKLPLEPDYFQIDSLLVTPHYSLPIEIKNIAGTLTIDPEFNQLSKHYQGIETGYPDPITQAKRQMLFLQKWFHNNKLPCPPVEFLVVFSNPSTILRMAPGHRLTPPYDKMIHAQNLVSEISKLNTKYNGEENEIIDLKKTKRLLLNQHQAIDDYFLLIKPTITNWELRDFLLLPSRRTAATILQSLHMNGLKKGVFYTQSF